MQADMDVINSNPKLAGIDLEKILTPAEELRPGAAQRCVMAQVHPLVAAAAIIIPSVGYSASLCRQSGSHI